MRTRIRQLTSLCWIIVRNLLLLILISFILFAVIDATPEEKGLSDWSVPSTTIVQRYVALSKQVLTLDLGTFEGKPLRLKILHGLRNTLLLIMSSIGVSLLAGFLLGLFSHLKQDHHIWTTIITVFDWFSLTPVFIIGYFVSLVLLVKFNITTDTSFWSDLHGPGAMLLYCLPALILGIGDGTVSEIVRNTREELHKAQEKWYMQAVRANGGNVLRHTVRSALLPIIITMNLRLVHLFGGVIVVEKIFNLKGLGWLTLEGIKAGNRELIFTVSYILVLLAVFIHLINEWLIFTLDPLIRERRTDETNVS